MTFPLAGQNFVSVFPGYYSPSLLNTDLSQSVHYDSPFKMLALHQMGQRFPNYQNTIGLHPHGNTTTPSVSAAAHTIRHFASTGIGMNNQMHWPQQHTVHGNNPNGSGHYPIPNNMTSSIGGNPNYASSHIGMNDNIMWPNQRNSIHTANSHYMGMDNNNLGNFHGNVRCSYPVSSTTRSENFLDSIFSSEQTPKNFTQESDQGDYKSSDKYTGIIHNTIVKDQVDITSTSSVMDQSIIPNKLVDESAQLQNPISQSVAEQSSTSTPTPRDKVSKSETQSSNSVAEQSSTSTPTAKEEISTLHNPSSNSVPEKYSASTPTTTDDVIITADNGIVHMDRESNWIDLVSDDLHLEDNLSSQNETENKSAKSLDDMIETKSENIESKDAHNVVSPKVTFKTEEDNKEQLQRDYSMEMDRWRNSCLSNDVNDQNEDKKKVMPSNEGKVAKSRKGGKKRTIVKSDCHKLDKNVGPNQKIRRSKKDVDDYGTTYDGDLSPDDRLNEYMKHGDAADSSSESEESKQDCTVREDQFDNNVIHTIVNKESSQSEENSHDISEENSEIDIEGTNESLAGQGEHEGQRNLSETQMQSKTCNSSMIDCAKSFKSKLRNIDSENLRKEREWVEKMADARNINMQDLEYKVLKKMMLDAYYQQSRTRKIATKYNMDEQNAVAKSERNPNYESSSRTSTRNKCGTVEDSQISSNVSSTHDTCIQSKNIGEHTSTRNKWQTVEDNKSSSDLSSTDEASVQSKNIGELSNFCSLTKAVHWHKQIIASTKPRNQMNEPLFRSKYILLL